jgi:hypothetical protein
VDGAAKYVRCDEDEDAVAPWAAEEADESCSGWRCIAWWWYDD